MPNQVTIINRSNIAWALVVLLLPVITNAQKKQLYCVKDSIDKWEKQNIVVAWGGGEISSFVTLKNGNTYEDTTTMPPSIRLKQQQGYRIIPEYSVDTVACALYVIRGDNSEPVCIAAFKINEYVQAWRHAIWEDRLTHKEYIGSSGWGEDNKHLSRIIKYISWDKTEFTKDIHVIKEKELH